MKSLAALLLLLHPLVSSYLLPHRLYPTPTPHSSLCAKEEVDEVEVEGAQFFGGSAAKEVLLDDSEDFTYTRTNPDKGSFPKSGLFKSPEAFALSNQVLPLLLQSSNALSFSPQFKYSSPLNPMSSFATPATRLQSAREYFKDVDIAVISGELLSTSTLDIRWKVALNWPTFWLPRVTIGGASRIEFELDSSTDSPTTLVSWTDKLNGGDSISLESRVLDQIVPRFWDAYHIGMAPSSEFKERFEQKIESLFPRPYKLFKSPATLELRASILDNVGRRGRLASSIPDSMFSNIIKTVGPSTEKYVPSGPIEISISSANENSKQSVIEWAIPVPSNFIAANENTLPVGDSDFLDDDEENEDEESNSDDSFFETQKPAYLVVTPKRQYATIKFGGSAQEENINKARKDLYDAVVKDGHKVVMDANGRPKFFFLQNNAKCCWTERGLGMAIYEWRPDFLQTNEVGIELEFL